MARSPPERQPWGNWLLPAGTKVVILQYIQGALMNPNQGTVWLCLPGALVTCSNLLCSSCKDVTDTQARIATVSDPSACAHLAGACAILWQRTP